MKKNPMVMEAVCLVAFLFLPGTLSKSVTVATRIPVGICDLSNFKNSERCCTGKGLGRETSLIDHKYIIELMSNYSLRDVWLPLKRKKFPNPTWVNGKIAQVNCKDDTWPNGRYNCGMWELRENFQFIKLGSCFERISKGVLCEKNDCSSCSMIRGLGTSICVQNNNTCFIMNHGPFSWEGAKHFCHENNLRMAVLDSKEKCDFAKHFKHRRDCKQLWIGLRKEEWYIPDKVDITPGTPYWAEDEPSYSGDCSIIFKNENGYWWKAEKCNSRHHSLCFSLDTKGKQPKTTGDGQKGVDQMGVSSCTGSSECTGTTLTVSVTVAVEVLSLIIIILIFIYVTKRKSEPVRYTRIRKSDQTAKEQITSLT